MTNGKTKAELQAEVDEANERIEDLKARLEEIGSIADSEDEDDEDDSAEDEDPDDLD